MVSTVSPAIPPAYQARFTEEYIKHKLRITTSDVKNVCWFEDMDYL
jgi:hypothetical protein